MSSNASENKKNKTRSWWVLASATGAFTLLGLLFLILLMSQGSSIREHAQDTNQFVRIDLATGQIEGATTIAPQPPEAAETPPAEPQTTPPVNNETIAVPPSEEPPIQAEPTPPKADATPVEPPAETAAAPETTEPTAPAEPPTAIDEQPAQAMATRPQLPPLPKSAPAVALAPAPKVELTETTEMGELPVKGPKGLTPWEYYGNTDFVRKEEAPLIAIVVTGLGIGRYTTELAMRLPSEITFAYTPYATESALWVRTARARGHEVLVDLPMQTEDYPASDPGPKALLETTETEKNLSNLRWAISRFPGIIGVISPTDETLTRTAGTVFPLATELGERGLIFAYANTRNRVVMNDLKRKAPHINIPADIIIDETMTKEAVEKQLQELTSIAKTKGHAVGITRPLPLSLKQITAWKDGLAKQGIQLAPLTAIVKAAN